MHSFDMHSSLQRLGLLALGALQALVTIGCNGSSESGIESISPLGEAVEALTEVVEPSDYLYVGDSGTQSIKRWNVDTGECLGNFVPPHGYGPPEPTFDSPRQLLISRGKLVAVAQNANLDLTGEIHRFDRQTGAFFDVLTESCAAIGATTTCIPADRVPPPFGPRGAVLLGQSPGIMDDVLYVADIGDRTTFARMQDRPGRIARINAQTGDMLLPDLIQLPVFPGTGVRPGRASERAQALVQGPDGYLYATIWYATEINRGLSQGGRILRIDPSVVPSTANSAKYLYTNAADNITGIAETATGMHRPGGLAFGPNGRLYVANFRSEPFAATPALPGDDDKIFVFDCTPNECIPDPNATIHFDHYDTAPAARNFAQSMVFGPGGYLYVYVVTSTNSNGDALTAEVRYYDVNTKNYGILQGCAQDPLVVPWFGAFGKTNPATLAYPNRASKLPPPTCSCVPRCSAGCTCGVACPGVP